MHHFQTADGALWLNKDMLSQFEYWQFWRNTVDSDVIRFLKLFTEVPLKDIEAMSHWKGAELNTAKRILADEATKMLHGPECLQDIHATVQSLFAKNSHNNQGIHDLDSLSKVTLKETELLLLDAAEGLPVVDILISAGFASSKGEAKR